MITKVLSLLRVIQKIQETPVKFLIKLFFKHTNDSNVLLVPNGYLTHRALPHIAPMRSNWPNKIF